MTEQEWVGSTNHDELLKYLSNKRRPPLMRKLRLFSCACCRRIWHLLSDKRSRRAVEVAERFADGQTTPKELDTAQREAGNLPKKWQGENWAQHNACIDAAATVALLSWRTTKPSVANTAKMASMTADACVTAVTGEYSDWHGGGGTWNDRIWSGWSATGLALRQQQLAVLRDIFGNQFRPASIAPDWLRWREGTIPKLAQAIYNDRTFEQLPVLADALEEAGCTCSDILSHCRQPGEHVRGCWVVDLLLGRE